MNALAAQPNVLVKLSGQGTFSHRVDPVFIAGVVGRRGDAFRFGALHVRQQLPIEKIWTDFGALWNTYQDAVAGFPESDRNNLFGETARRVYAL